ncbi:hypothetical protein F5B17DRAFT_450768 [Nemania serpens]|nr:hypothetical protein F5B17DRAFT_450768 [Nemania serpens]
MASRCVSRPVSPSPSDPATDKPASVGSNAWTGGKEYKGDHALRIDHFNGTVNLEALRAYASELQKNQPCNVSPNFSVGQDNLVRKITFDDGVEWIARLRMSPMKGEPGTANMISLDLRSELATMELVRYAKREAVYVFLAGLRFSQPANRHPDSKGLRLRVG